MSDDDINNDMDDVNFDDDVGFDDEAGFDDFNTGSGADSLKDNPMVKIGAVLAILAVIVGAIILFGGGGGDADPSALRPVVAEQAGGAQTEESVVSERYQQEIDARNVQEVERAMQTGTSALPVTTNSGRGRIELQAEPEQEEDPLERWRMLQEQRKKARPTPKVEPNITAPVQPQVDTRAQAVTELSRAMSSQMESILDAREIPELQISQITPIEYIEDMVEAREKEEEERREAAEAAAKEEESEEIILLPAGEIEYAQLITEANSDIEGPILAQIASGPLKGSKLLGSFQTKEEHLVLNFDQIVINDISYPANAVAVDPGTAAPGMATQVDKRYFTRVVLPAAGAFIEGVGRAVAQSESTTVSVGDNSTSSTQEDLDIEQEIASGVEELGREVNQELDEIANQTQPLIVVDAGTAMGILFVDPVIED